MRKIEIKGKKFDYDEVSKTVVLSSDITGKVLSAVRRYPKGGEGRNWRVIIPKQRAPGWWGTVWWITDLKSRIRYKVEKDTDKRNYVIRIENYRVW